MLKKLEALLKEYFYSVPDSEPERNVDEQLMIAATVLFLEMAYADFELSAEEETHIQQILRGFFDLGQDKLNVLIESARESRKARQDIFTFTRQIKSQFDRNQKLWILENLWRLIYADGHMDRYEDALIRKITNLLGLEHGDMIRSKLKVKNS
jgi:uncharacterized tellurite resistance protein B-like protein